MKTQNDMERIIEGNNEKQSENPRKAKRKTRGNQEQCFYSLDNALIHQV